MRAVLGEDDLPVDLVLVERDLLQKVHWNLNTFEILSLKLKSRQCVPLPSMVKFDQLQAISDNMVEDIMSIA